MLPKKGRDRFLRAMRPGKPLMVGRHRGVPMLGPGNPVSTLVCSLLFPCRRSKN
jgi:molybdopterin biosynthesis enzyme